MLDTEKLKDLVAKGNLAEAINLMLNISNQFLLSFNKDILLLSSRYHAIQSDKRKGVISNEEYLIETNAITYSFLELRL